MYRKPTYLDQAYDGTKRANLSRAKLNKFTTRTKSFLAEENERLRTRSFRGRDLPVDEGKLSYNPSVSFDVDKPSVVRSLIFDSSTKQGNGYQSYSSNLVRQNNLKREVQDYKEKKKLDASIRLWNRKVDEATGDQKKKGDTSVEEEEEEFQYDDTPYVSSLTMHGSTSHMKLFNKTFANVEASKYDPVKENQLAQLVKKRLEKGYTVAQMAMDPVFENVLDICCDKNYFSSDDNPDAAVSLDDWRALRKCKYLRITQRNIASLKEATLGALKDK